LLSLQSEMLDDITSYFAYNPNAELCYTSRPRLNVGSPFATCSPVYTLCGRQSLARYLLNRVATRVHLSQDITIKSKDKK